MAYYLVSFHLTQQYFDATPAEQEDLPKQEIEHGKKLFKVGIWKHAYTVPGKVKNHDWGIFQTKDQAELESYLAEYPMAKLGMYTRDIYEVEIVDPPWIVGVMFTALRAVGLFKPWKAAPVGQTLTTPAGQTATKPAAS